MQGEFNSRRGMRGMNRDGNSRGGGIPFGVGRFMGRGPPIFPGKPSGMRNRETGGPRMGAGDFRGGNFEEGRFFDDARDRWEPPRSLSMRNSIGSPLDDGNYFPMNNFGPGPDHGRFRQNSSPNFNSSDGFRNPRGGFGGHYRPTEMEIRRARRMFQIPPGRFSAPPGPFPPRGNMLMSGRGMRPPPFAGYRNRRNAMDKNKKSQKQSELAQKKPSPPWFDEEVFKLLKDKGKAHKRMKRSNTEANVQAFKELRKEVRRLTRQKYNDYCIKEGIPNKYTEAAKAKKQKAEEAAAAAAAKAALENNNEASSEVNVKTEDTAEVADNKDNTANAVEENSIANVEENDITNAVEENSISNAVEEINMDSAQLANNNSSVLENSNCPPVENICDNSSLMEESAFETAES